jgi:hypothetical protein
VLIFLFGLLIKMSNNELTGNASGHENDTIGGCGPVNHNDVIESRDELRTKRSKLLFRTSFESNVELTRVDEYLENGSVQNQNALQFFSGTDSTTGFAWPPKLRNLVPNEPLKLLSVVYDGGAIKNSHPTIHYMQNSIVNVRGYDKKGTTRALQMKMIKTPEGTQTAQNNLFLHYDELDEPAPLYIRYWMRPSKEIFVNLVPGKWRWHAIATLKAGSDAAFRLRVLISTDGDKFNRPFYQLTADHCGISPDDPAQKYKCSNPVHWQERIEMSNREQNAWRQGSWMPVEIYLKRNPTNEEDGRFYVAINGRTLGDLSAKHYRFWDNNKTPQTYWILQSLYGLRDHSHAVVLDDLEFWSGFPCSAPPCVQRRR